MLKMSAEVWVEFQRADTTFGPVREEIQGGSSLNTGMLVGEGRHVKVIEKCSVVGDGLLEIMLEWGPCPHHL